MDTTDAVRSEKHGVTSQYGDAVAVLLVDALIDPASEAVAELASHPNARASMAPLMVWHVLLHTHHHCSLQGGHPPCRKPP